MTSPASPQVSLVIPAYNEARRLRRTLEATAAYLSQRPDGPFEILIVDDGSTDTTIQVAQEWASTIATVPTGDGPTLLVRCLRCEPNRGKGHAVRQGVLQAQGKRVLFMDADLATPIEEIEKLESVLDANPTVQVVIGSRPLPSSELLVRQPRYREWAGRLFNRVVQLVATPGIHDTQCGFKMMAREAAQAVFSRCVLNGFSFDVEMLFIARRLGYGIVEQPVRWAHQEGAAAFATSGSYLRHGLRMIGDLARIRWAHRRVHRASTLASHRLPPANPSAPSQHA